MTHKEINQGFKVLPVRFDKHSTAIRSFFYKQHAVRSTSAQKPSDRTLFMINIPPFCNEVAMKNLFKKCGEVTDVFFHSKPSSELPAVNESEYFPTHKSPDGYKVVYVVFKTSAGLQKALNLNPIEPLILSRKNSPVICGLKKWNKEYCYKIPNTEMLQNEIDEYMKLYDAKMEEKQLLDKQAATEPDKDGWVTVTGKGRNPGFVHSEVVEEKIKAKEKKRSKKELKNFYRFQIRESKVKHLELLRTKLEEDKKRIEKMKRMRKFKPFR